MVVAQRSAFRIHAGNNKCYNVRVRIHATRLDNTFVNLFNLLHASFQRQIHTFKTPVIFSFAISFTLWSLFIVHHLNRRHMATYCAHNSIIFLVSNGPQRTIQPYAKKRKSDSILPNNIYWRLARRYLCKFHFSYYI